MVRGKKFLVLAVSELVSFAAAVSGFTGFTDSDSRDKSFPLHKKWKYPDYCMTTPKGRTGPPFLL